MYDHSSFIVEAKQGQVSVLFLFFFVYVFKTQRFSLAPFAYCVLFTTIALNAHLCYPVIFLKNFYFRDFCLKNIYFRKFQETVLHFSGRLFHGLYNTVSVFDLI